MKVRDVMTSPVVTATRDASFPELVDLLVKYEISAVPIVDDGGRLIGIVSEADLVSKEAYGGRRRRVIEVLGDLVSGGETAWAVKGKAHTAAQLMTRPVASVAPSDDLRLVARHMVDERRKRMPVVEDGALVGIVSRSDVLRAMHRTDADVAVDVANLLADPMRSPDSHAVTANVHAGCVELHGSVLFPDDVAVLTAMVWSIPGVVDVRNEATHRESAPR